MQIFYWPDALLSSNQQCLSAEGNSPDQGLYIKKFCFLRTSHLEQASDLFHNTELSPNCI